MKTQEKKEKEAVAESADTRLFTEYSSLDKGVKGFVDYLKKCIEEWKQAGIQASLTGSVVLHSIPPQRHSPGHEVLLNFFNSRNQGLDNVVYYQALATFGAEMNINAQRLLALAPPKRSAVDQLLDEEESEEVVGQRNSERALLEEEILEEFNARNTTTERACRTSRIVAELILFASFEVNVAAIT